MTDLTTIHCVGCEGGIPALSISEVKTFLSQINQWSVSDNGKQITKRFPFKNFYKTMAFVNAIAWIANQENHHPDLQIGFNYCTVQYTTHAVDGLTQNDFICAAKVDALSAETI
jgi:4a-hydroxytetrahydrobiopterin dehydratase